MHFEDIWEAAENVGAHLEDASEEELVSKIRGTLDKLDAVANLPGRQAELLGDILFDLCQITRQQGINSAAALRWATEARKSELLDPEEPHRESADDDT